MADTAVLGTEELDALRLELGPCGRDVGNAKRDSAHHRQELDPVAFRLPESERHLARSDLARVVRVQRQPERLVVEGARPLDVARRDRDEIDSLDLHHGSEPSRYDA